MTRLEAIEALRRARKKFARFASYNPFKPTLDALADLDAAIAFLESLPESVSPPEPKPLCGHPECSPWTMHLLQEPPPPDPAPSAERCACGHDEWEHFNDEDGEYCTGDESSCPCPKFRPSPRQEAENGRVDKRVSRGRDDDGGDMGIRERHRVSGTPVDAPLTPATVERWLTQHTSHNGGYCSWCAAAWPCPVVRLGRDWLRMREELDEVAELIDSIETELCAIDASLGSVQLRARRAERELAEMRREHGEGMCVERGVQPRSRR